MTDQELLQMYVKLSKRIDVLEEALDILADEPFASGEPDNAEFCAALKMRIDRFCDAAEQVRHAIAAPHTGMRS